MSPVRDLISRLIQSDSNLISNDTRIFLRDVLDHAQEVHETLQIQRELAFNLMEMYMSSMSNRMNEVMKVLTIMASIFIPLTFIAGVYGMNFRFMPELEWKYGYFLSLGLMLLVFVSLLLYFKKKKWF
jgi:magnesium transporter